MKSWTMVYLFASFFLVLAVSQNYVDFSYTEYDQNQGKPPRPIETISIKPNREIIQGYFFPEACYLAKKLDQQRLEDSQQLANYDMDSMIDNIKTDFTELLKVSEKIKKKKANIEELSEMSGRTTNVTVVEPKDLEALKIEEAKLVDTKREITSLTDELEGIVKDSMRNSGGNQFSITAVNFQIQSLRLKLEYLKNLKRNSNDAENSRTKDQYNKYFADLRAKFEDQTGLIDDLSTILKNENQIGALRAKILSLRGKIDLANLMIEEKQVCAKERDQIKKFQKNDYEIKAHMSNLRQKKKDINNIKNKYCEGVAKKLEDRVKKVLLSYDYTFECAEGLQEKRNQRDDDRADLEKAQARLKYLETSGGIDGYKRRFDENRQYIKSKQEELSRFTIPDYYHDITELNRLIAKAQTDLENAEEHKRFLASPSNNKVIDYRRIQELVSRIKKLKGTYCQDYEKYERNAHQIWKWVEKYEAQVEYTSKIRGIYQQEINQLRDLESLFGTLRSRILKRIE